MLSYAFDAMAGETPDSTRRKRRLVDALMMGSSRTPRSVGEGIHAVGASIAAALLGRQADRAEAAGRKTAKADIERIAPLFPPAPGGGSFDPKRATAEMNGANMSVATNGEMPVHRRALLNTISGPESGGDYDIVYGGGRFDDFSDHPRRAIPITSGPNKGKTSSAAGKYQFLGSTWDQYRDKLGLPDFSPGSQDTAAWELASDTYRDSTGGDLDQVLQSGDPQAIANVGKVLNGVWTSLPGGIEAGTNTDRFLSAFQRNMGGGGGQNRVQGSAGDDAIDGVEGIYRGGPDSGPSHDPAMNAYVQDQPLPFRTLPTQNVPPTNAGLQNPQTRGIVKALMSGTQMGGAPQAFSTSNLPPGVRAITEALLPRRPAQQPAQMAQAQGLPEMAGNAPWTGPSANDLLRAGANEWLNDSERGMVNTLYEQQMRRQQADYVRQQQMADPRYQIGLEADRLALDKGRYELDQARRKRNLVETKNGIYDADTGQWITNPNAPAEGNEFGLTPQLMQDKDGNYFYAQPTKDGRILRSKVEDGAVPVNPYEKSFQSSKGRKEGEALGEATASLPEKIATADYSIGLIDEMLTHPGRETATGLSGTLDPRNYFAGTDATDFNIRRKQIEGRTFLEAFNSLRGGGQITEAEGQKATVAMARLDAAQSDEQFFAALEELKELLDLGKQRAIAKVQAGQQSAPDQGNPVPSAGNVPAAAIDMLRSDPSLAEQFDAKFGPGAAARILGGQ